MEFSLVRVSSSSLGKTPPCQDLRAVTASYGSESSLAEPVHTGWRELLPNYACNRVCGCR